MTQGKRSLIWLLATALTGTMALFSGIFLGAEHNFLLAFLLALSAIGIYFLQVFFVSDRNWLDFRAVFSGVWLGTIGLASMRLAEYQEVWLNKTWVVLSATYLCLQVGVTVGLKLAPSFSDKAVAVAKKLKIGRIHLKKHPNRLFGICVIATLVGLACFVANIAIKGFVPAFSNIFNAYVVFYTKLHVFAVAAVAVAPLCYYCIATQPLSLFKKVILGLCIFYLIFAFPILAVSRGVFVVAALGLSVCVYYLHGKRLWVLLLCIAVIGSGYMLASELRNYTNEQLNTFFQPSQIQLPNHSGDTDPSDPTDGNNGGGNTGNNTFSLSPKAAFLYSYLTVSHDNFNEAVQNNTTYTYGARQFAPFNVIVRSDRIEQMVSEAPNYFIRPHFNTVNLIGDFFYDFGIWGVMLCTLLWALIFGFIQGFYDKSKNIFVLFILCNTMVPVVLCFFASWMSNFTHWMIWGVAFLLAVAAYVSCSPRTIKDV